MSLRVLLAGLSDNPSGHAYTVVPVPGHQDVLLGIDMAKHPVLFVRAVDGAPEPPLRTSKVSLSIGQSYNLAALTGTPKSELLHALHCEASEAADVDTFLVLCEAFLARYEGSRMDQEALTSFFRSMVRLFAVTPAKDLQGEQQGLWGELFMMSQVRGFRFWAPFWHSEVTRRFDFSYRSRRVEVKTTTGPERIHHFSHRQIYALKDEEILVASLFTKEDDSGLSLGQLIAECRTALLGNPDYLKLEKAVRQAGMEHPSDAGPIFDAAEAGSSLAWYRSTDAPHFRMAEPAGVSDTRYKVDLSTAPRVEVEELDEWLLHWPLEVPAGSTDRRDSNAMASSSTMQGCL